MRKILILVAATGLGLSSFSGAADLTVQPLRSVESSQIAGYSMLVRKKESLLTRIETGMRAEDREVWWLVFNNPDACLTQPCTLDDIYRQETRADIIRADNDMAGQEGTGNICLRAGHSGRSLMPGLGLTPAGLTDVHAAEIQVIVAGSSPGLESLIMRRNGGFADNCAGSQCSALMVAIHTPRLPLLVAVNLAD